MLTGICYDPDTEEVYARFKGGAVYLYEYSGVNANYEASAVTRVLFATSQGQAFNKVFKESGEFRFAKLEGSDIPEFHA